MLITMSVSYDLNRAGLPMRYCDIVAYLLEHPQSTISQVATGTTGHLSRASIMLKELREMGLVEFSEGQKPLGKRGPSEKVFSVVDVSVLLAKLKTNEDERHAVVLDNITVLEKSLSMR